MQHLEQVWKRTRQQGRWGFKIEPSKCIVVCFAGALQDCAVLGAVQAAQARCCAPQLPCALTHSPNTGVLLTLAISGKGSVFAMLPRLSPLLPLQNAVHRRVRIGEV